MKSFKARLKSLRGDMTQAKFARKLGLAQNSYHRYEAGERVPDIDVLSKMASRLGVSTDWLLGRTEKIDEISDGQRASDNMTTDQDSDIPSCGPCGGKDKTIANQAKTIVNQAESINNLTRSLAKVFDGKRSA